MASKWTVIKEDAEKNSALIQYLQDKRHQFHQVETEDLPLRQFILCAKDGKKAYEIQRKLFTQPQNLVKIQHDFLLQPAFFVSGDGAGIFALTNDCYALYLFDVAGHGAGAALLSAYIQGVFDTLKRLNSSLLQAPEQLFSYLNQALIERNINKHVTVIYAVLNRSSLSLNYACAGHFPLPILLNAGHAQYLQTKGMALGLFADAQFEVQSCSLPPCFRLLLFSDGVLELMPEDCRDKKALLLSWVESCNGDINLLRQRLSCGDADSIPDDLTILAIGGS